MKLSMASTKRFTLPFILLFGMVYFSDEQDTTVPQCTLINNRVAISVCPAGFGYTAEGIPKCYAVVTQKLGWDGAQANCRRLHPRAHLVVINSALENQVVQEILKNFDCAGSALTAAGQGFFTNNYWTSGRRIYDSCTSPFIWKASNGQAQSLAYTNWSSGEPNCAFNQEFCLSFYKGWNAQWNDIICSWAVCSVCEVVKLQQ